MQKLMETAIRSDSWVAFAHNATALQSSDSSLLTIFFEALQSLSWGQKFEQVSQASLIGPTSSLANIAMSTVCVAVASALARHSAPAGIVVGAGLLAGVDARPVTEPNAKRLGVGPVVVNPIADYQMEPGETFSLTINLWDVFSHPNSDENLCIHVQQSDGSPLPDWLSLEMAAPVLLGSLGTSKALEVAKAGDYAYVANDFAGLKIIDVSDPAYPYLIGSLDVFGAAGVAVVGNHVYVADYTEGLKIIDVSDPANPCLMGSLDTYSAYGVTVSGNYAYVADHSEGLKIIDVSDPANPNLTGSLDTYSAYGVAVSGDYAYVADGPQGLKIIDVSDPASPTLMGSLDTSVAVGVDLAGNYAYVADYTEGLKVIDVSNPANPTLTGYLDTDEVQGVALVGNSAYVADGPQGLKIIDVSDPANPTLMGSLDTYLAAGVTVVGNYAYVADDTEGLKVVDVRTRELSGVPGLPDVGTYSIDVIAEDSMGKSITDTFVLRMGSILVVNPIPDQSVQINNPFLLTFDEETFNDLNGNSLTYLSLLEGGSPLPTWLAFDPPSRTFSGTPLSGDQNLYFVEVTATNPLSESKSDVFELDVLNRAPTVQFPLLNQITEVGSTFGYIFSENAFIDEDGDSLSYNATLSGSALPIWLSFNGAARTFSGTPVSGDQAIYRIDVTASDDFGGSVLSSFDLTVPNRAPTLENPLSNQIAPNGALFSFAVPANTFVDPDEDPLTYNATLQDDNPLPIWLSFDAPTQTFSGTPSVRGNHFIKTSAQDPFGASANAPFEIVVPNTAPIVSNPLSNQVSEIGQAFNYVVPANTFFDLDNDPLTYSSRLQGGNPLPAWLNFNPATRTFSGTTTDRNSYSIEVIATDGAGGEGIAPLEFRVANNAPIVNQSIENQSVNVGVPYLFTFHEMTFTDADNDTLSYSATPLPSWLSFNEQTFSGTPVAGDQNTYSINVNADDSFGGEASTSFNLTVPNRAPVVSIPLSDHKFTADMLSFYSVPEETFTDADGDLLTYTSQLTDNQPLPVWLTFDGQTFSGTIPASQSTPLSIEVRSEDPFGANATSSFELSVNLAPVLEGFIENQEGSVGNPFLFTFNPNIFSDPDGDALAFNSELSDGTPLPSWLSFYPETYTYLGSPGINDKGIIFVKLIANDGFGGTADGTFGIAISNLASNNPPLLTLKIPQQMGKTDELFDYVFPVNTFTDPDGDSLSYSSNLEGGSPLPSWLIFTSELRRFNGIPHSPEAMRVTVVAEDSKGGIALDTFSLTIEDATNYPPTVLNPIGGQTAKVGQKFEFVIPLDTFVDVNEDPLSFSVQRFGGQQLPKWLTFDPASRAFSGKPDMWDTDTYADRIHSIELIASDGHASVTTAFPLSVEGESFWELLIKAGAPIAAVASSGYAGYRNRATLWNMFLKSKYQKPAEQAIAGSAFEREIDLDPDLVAKVQAFRNGKVLRGGKPLPDWLRYDDKENKLTGIPQDDDRSKLAIRVFGHDERIREEFTLRVKTATDGDDSDEEVELGFFQKLCSKTPRATQMKTMSEPLLEDN